MQSPEAGTATTPTQIHLALAHFADEVVGTLARLFLYVGALASPRSASCQASATMRPRRSRGGAWLIAHIRPLPSASLIHQIKQPLTQSLDTPKAAAET
jgi:hypothetical protein